MGDPKIQAELQRLREDNEALRFSSFRFAELADRLSQRVRELERVLAERDSLNATGSDDEHADSYGRRPF